MLKEELITMSQKEMRRLDIIVKLKEKRCSQKEAAKRLGITLVMCEGCANNIAVWTQKGWSLVGENNEVIVLTHLVLKSKF